MSLFVIFSPEHALNMIFPMRVNNYIVIFIIIDFFCEKCKIGILLLSIFPYILSLITPLINF